MTQEETLALYKLGKDAWNKWANDVLTEIKEAKDFNERTIVENNNFTIFNIELFNYRIGCNGFIFPSQVEITLPYVKNDKKTNLGFSNCEFHSTFDSQKINYKLVNFRDVKFHQPVIFTGSNFFSFNCLNTVFYNDAMFTRVIFEETADFRNTVFKGRADFTKSDFQVSIDLQGVQFSYLPIVLGASFKETPHFDGVQFPSYVNRNYDSVSFYRTFRQLAAKSGDHEREIDFFGRELKSRSEWWMRGWVLCYEVFSDFGHSIWRPFTAMLFITFLSFNIYLAKHEQLWTKSILLDNFTCNSSIQSDPRSAAFQLSLEKTFPIIAGKDEKSKQNMICLYGGDKDLPITPDSIALFGFFQSLISLVLLFLVGLGFRNRFRLK